MKFTLALAALAAASLSTPALADTCGFSITGLNTASFELDCSPTNVYSPREGVFNLYDVPIVFNGIAGTGEIDFMSPVLGGGLTLDVEGVGGLFFQGDPLFSGYEDAPTFVPGDYVGTDGVSGPTIYNISISNVSAAVPEPATWAMMLLGFGAIGVSARRRRKAALAAA